MFNRFRKQQFELYNKERLNFVDNFQVLIDLEKYFSDYLFTAFQKNIQEIKRDYDEASYLFPFWQNYPPDERGRKPRGDQFPWIEVGEHAIGDKIGRLISKDFIVRDTGIPTGPDKRFLVTSNKISQITSGITDSAWLFIDIKSVGPRDDFDHTVMSHNQISGDGLWRGVNDGIKNSIIIAKGKYQKHKFYCSIPPLYILSDGTIAPIINIAVKPVYKMMSLEKEKNRSGQPLKRITVASLPNGLLLFEKPGYLKKYPSLFFPGKDDKNKNPLKVRCRVDFRLLKQIDSWRIKDLQVEDSTLLVSG